MYLASAATQYLWTYPVDLLPLLLLAIYPAGRMWGLDAGSRPVSATAGRSDPHHCRAEHRPR